MKLVVAVVQDRDRRKVTETLLEHGYSFTNVASTGGFLREGSVTFLIGTENDRVEEAVSLIGQSSKTREQFVNVFPPTIEPLGACIPTPVKVEVGGAVVFVLPIERFERL